MSSIAIIDADMVMYIAASAAQHVWYNIYPKDSPEEEQFLIKRCEYAADVKSYLKGLGKEKEDFNVVPDLEVKEFFQAKFIADNIIQKIYDRTGAGYAVFYLSDKECFRHKLAKRRPYKERTKEKPVHYQGVKDYLLDKYRAEIVTDLEADDAVGIMAEACNNSDEPFVIATGDKDLDQIPGIHYNFQKERLYNVGLEESVRFFFYQVLTGDATDSIDGLPGMGPAKANKVLAGCTTFDDMHKAVRNAYVTHEIGSKKNKDKRLMFPEESAAIEYLNEVANLIYIRRQYDEGVTL
jgi:hypothetical protein